MPTRSFHKSDFVTEVPLQELIESERNARPWLPHSLGLLVLSPRFDQVALVLPVKLSKSPDRYHQVPPQRRFQEQYSDYEMAAAIKTDVTDIRCKRDDYRYLGSALGNRHKGGTCYPYGKWVHWMGVRLPTYRPLLSCNQCEYKSAVWYRAPQLPAMVSTMSERKYWMLMKALQRVETQFTYGPLVRVAQSELKSTQRTPA